MLVVTQGAELAESAGPVWGSGGWDPPETREARDWLCLGRLLGWSVDVVGPAELAAAPPAAFVVWTGPPPDAALEAVLGERLARDAVLVVRRAAGEIGMGAGDRVVAEHDGRPIAVARPAGRGAVLELGFDPSAARDADGAFTVLLRELLLAHAPRPVTARDWSGTLVLRMDDPGSGESAYREGWRYPKLGRAEWAAIGADLRRRDGRLTAAYVPAFVDDGDPRRGDLFIDGAPAERRAGAVHPSSRVRYRAPDLVWDGAEEHAALLEQRDVVDLALHGHAHVHPDRGAWAAAPDRATSEAWYRDFVPAADALDDAHHPLPLGLTAIEEAFGERPATLVCPGDAWTTDALVRALDLGFELVSSYYLALRQGDCWVWCQHVCAPYLDQPDPRALAAGLPVVGYFHDYEPSVHGVGWLTAQLDAWEAAGVTRMISLGDLAAALRERSLLPH